MRHTFLMCGPCDVLPVVYIVPVLVGVLSCIPSVHCNMSQYVGQRWRGGYKRQLLTPGGSVLRLEENKKPNRQERRRGRRRRRRKEKHQKKRESPQSFVALLSVSPAFLFLPLEGPRFSLLKPQLVQHWSGLLSRGKTPMLAMLFMFFSVIWLQK